MSEQDSLREKENFLREREFALREKEVEAKIRLESKSLWFTSPLLICCITTISGLIGTGIGAILQGSANLSLERQKFEFTLIQDALEAPNQGEAATKLRFLVNSGVITSLDGRKLKDIAKNSPSEIPVTLERRIDLIEKINANVGALVADANGVIAVIVKQAPLEQRNQVIQVYNEEQARWFGLSLSYQALLELYFSQSVSDKFAEGIVNATKKLDVELYKFARESTEKQRMESYEASEQVRHELQEWNQLVRKHLQSR